MQQVMPGLLSRTPTTSGALIPGSKRFASSLSGPGRAVLWDHKTCASIAEACSGLLQKRAGPLAGLTPRPGPCVSGLFLPLLLASLQIQIVSSSPPMGGYGSVTLQAERSATS